MRRPEVREPRGITLELALLVICAGVTLPSPAVVACLCTDVGCQAECPEGKTCQCCPYEGVPAPCYQIDIEECCNGHVGTGNACCGDVAYDITDKACCPDGYGGGTVFDPDTEACCQDDMGAGEVYDPDGETCCLDGFPHATVFDGADMDCCYDPVNETWAVYDWDAPQRCCQGCVGDGNECCWDEAYYGETHGCCEASPPERSEVYDPSTHGCCGGLVYEIASDVCCNNVLECPEECLDGDYGFCGWEFGGQFFACYMCGDPATPVVGWWFKEEVVGPPAPPCRIGPIAATREPTELDPPCQIGDRISDFNGPPLLNCRDWRQQEIWVGPTWEMVYYAVPPVCTYHHLQIIAVTGPPPCVVETTLMGGESVSVSTQCAP